MIRIDKYLTEMDRGTRTQIKEAARKGRIMVNGVTEKKADRKVNPDVDEVSMDGILVAYAEYEYFMLNKPKGVVSATQDKLHPTVISLLADRQRNDLFPVGRLDIDTEGLLFITNDGALAHQLLSPKKHVDKVYYAEIEGNLPPDSVERLKQGILLTDGTPVLPALLEIQSRSEGHAQIRLTIHEGKFHQVKRMFEALDCQVAYLKRESMGTLHLDSALKPGEYRRLSDIEINQLKEINHAEK